MNLWLIKGIALLGCLGALAGGVWWLHHTWWGEGYAARAAADTKALVAAQHVQTIIQTRIVTQWRTRIKVIHQRGATIIREVPHYVTRYDNAHCTVNVGFVSLWNDANRLSVPTPASSVNEAPSSVKLSDVEAQHSREATICHANNAQLRELQEWVIDTHSPHA